MECKDVKVDEELPTKNKNISFINPSNHHYHSKENEIQDQEEEDTDAPPKNIPSSDHASKFPRFSSLFFI